MPATPASPELGTGLDLPGLDPDLAALPEPRRQGRRLTVAVMMLTLCAALGLAWSLRSEAAYALSSSEPLDIGVLTHPRLGDEAHNHYVFATGALGASGAVGYTRPVERGRFRLHPVAGNPRIWVETRVPEGFDPRRYLPPTAYAGRLVPFDEAGLRYRSLRGELARSGVELPPDAWLLIDGASPGGSQWAAGLVAMLLAFATWNAAGLLRIVRVVRDR